METQQVNSHYDRLNQTVNIVNLTAHSILEMSSNIEYKASGIIARVNMIQKSIFTLNTGVAITKTIYDSIVGLPEPKQNTFYLVSAVVINALRENNITRDDVIAPNKVIRDSNGTVKGCVGFRLNG